MSAVHGEFCSDFRMRATSDANAPARPQGVRPDGIVRAFRARHEPNPSPSGHAGGLFDFRSGSASPHAKDRCHDQNSHHQRPSLRERRQASRQSHRLAAARRRPCPLPPADRLTTCSSSARPTNTARRPSSAPSQAGQDVRAFCDAQHAIQADIYRRFGLSFDHFGRTSSPQNHALTQHFYRRLDAAGLIEERELAANLVAARPALSPGPLCARHLPALRFESAQRRPMRRLRRAARPAGTDRSALGAVWRHRAGDPRQSSFVPAPVAACRRLREWIDSRTGWPPFVVSTAKSWLTAELRDRCITRDLAWGIAGAARGFDGKVFYVWFDAPIGYIAATQEWAEADPDIAIGGNGGGRPTTLATSSFSARTTSRSTP